MTPTVANPLEQLKLSELRTRTSIKWREYPDDVLPLWVAETDVTLAEPIVRAVVDAVSRGDTGYSSGTAFAQAVSNFASERWGWDGLAVDRTAVVPDVMLGVVEALRLLTAPGDAVVVNCPVYPPFFSFVEHMDRRIVEAPLGADGRIDLDLLGAAFEQATAGKASAAYLLCNPHNPTGTAHTVAELETVAALADSHHVRVVVDEIHAPIVLAGATFVPYLSVAGGESAFSLMSASKAWNLAGLKAALLIAGPDAGADLARLPEEVSHGVSHIGVVAHTAAVSEGAEWLDAFLDGLIANRRLVDSLLQQELAGVVHVGGEATFLAWLDFVELSLGTDDGALNERGVMTDSSGPAAFFLESARVALSPGAAFGTGGAGHARLNIGTSAAILTEAIERMGSAVRDR